MITVNGVLKIIVPNKERFQILIIGNLLLSLITLNTYFTNDFHFTFHLISNAYHNGALVNSLIALFLLMKFLKKPSILYSSLLITLIFLAIISDRFFLFYFIAPALITIILSLLNKKNLPHKLTLLLGVSITSYYSLSFFTYLVEQGILTIFSRDMEFTLEKIQSSWNILYEQYSYYFLSFDTRSFALYFSLLTFCFLLYTSIKKFRALADANNLKILLSIYLISFIIIVFFAPVIIGEYTGWDTIRYNYQVIILGLIFFGFTINYSNNLISKYLSPTLLFCLAGLLIFSFSILLSSSFRKGLSNTIHFYPERISTIDKLIKNKNLKFGVATYWDSKYTMMLSKNKLRVYNCYPTMNPSYHAMNEEWFYINPLTQDSVNFTFVIIQDTTHERFFRETLKEPLEILDSNGVRIFITKPFRFSKIDWLPYYIK
jgi:hypothetical protein